METAKKMSSVKKTAGIPKMESKSETRQAKAKSTRSAAPVWTTVGTAGEEIADEAYRGKKSLVRVEVAEGVTEIGSGAFSGCVNLESVKIPKSVTRIGDEAFRGCSKLQNVVMAEGIEEIGDRAFAVCKSLKEIAIPASVKEIEGKAFVACVRLDRISFASGETRIYYEEAFKWCAVVRKVEIPVGLQEGCALLASRGYKAIRKVANRNAKYGDDVELKVAKLELWSCLPTIGTAWVDSLDEVDDDLAECARDEGGGWDALDISDIGGELKIDGEVVDIDFDSVRRVKLGVGNTWSEFRDKIGIYSVDIDKAGCATLFATAGGFDQKKLTFYYKTAIGPGCYNHPEDATIDLLDRVEYDGVELELDYDGERDNDGCVFTVFNEGKYAEYGYGCDVEDLNWKKFPENNWDWFGPSEWARILSSQPQFADKCDKWGSFGAEEWETILRNQPQLADRCQNWDKLGACHWARILSSQPQFADKCDKWDSFGAKEWKTILRSQPRLADRCQNWDDFGACHWSEILSEQPQLADKCDKWPNFDGSDWVDLLKCQPQFADHCDRWADFNGYEWRRLLVAAPQFAERCHAWESFSARGWAWLLSRQPQFADKCDKWSVLDGDDWVMLLSEQPQFADKCDKWERFDDIDIARLASEQESFVPKLLQQKKLSPWAAAIVLARRPSVKVDTKLLSGEVDDEAYEQVMEDVYPFKTPWAYLLSQQPQFAGKVKEWKTLSVADWLGLLSKQPGFSAHCDWKKVEEEWDADWCPNFVAESDELIALIRAKTDIDIMEGIDFDTFVKSPTLAKDLDLWRDHLGEWDMSQAEIWSEILARYPDLVARFEAEKAEWE